MRILLRSFTAALLIGPNVLWAAPCDYRLSEMIGGAAAGTVATSGAAVSGSGAGMTAAGFYTLQNAVTGSTMLASTAGGVSGAGTVGIMGGTAGLIGGTASVLLSPVVIGVGAAVAVGVGGFEAGCLASDAWYADRIEDYDAVLSALRRVSDVMDVPLFMLIESSARSAVVVVPNKDNKPVVYKVADLYFANGELMNRDWLRNTSIGHFGAIIGQPKP